MRGKNSDLQNQRIRQYFLDAGKEVIEKKGVNDFSTRTVAQLAGYTSATTYNYFKDAKQLLSLSLVHAVAPYFKSVQQTLRADEPSYITWLKVWRKYAAVSFKAPEIYQYVFFSEHTHEVLQETTNYYTIFNDDELVSDPNADKIFADTIEARDAIWSGLLADAKVVASEEELAHLMIFVHALVTGMGQQIIAEDGIKYQDQLNLFMSYLIDYLLAHSSIKESKEELLKLAMAD